MVEHQCKDLGEEFGVHQTVLEVAQWKNHYQCVWWCLMSVLAVDIGESNDIKQQVPYLLQDKCPVPEPQIVDQII